jgi:hypothetical protein
MVALAFAVAIAGSLAAASSAPGAEATRESYREAAEPVCQANTAANERILAGVRGDVKHDKLGAAAIRFRRAAHALARTRSELAKIPRPTSDGPRLSRWLGFIGTEVVLLERTSRYLEAGNKRAAEGMVVRLQGTASRANNAVVPFEFHYCRFDPSLFT